MALTLFGKCSPRPLPPQVGRAPELGAGAWGALGARGGDAVRCVWRGPGLGSWGARSAGLAPRASPIVSSPGRADGRVLPGQFWDGRF